MATDPSETTVIRSLKSSSGAHAIIAFFLWLGAIPFMALVVFASFLFLPLHGFFLVLGLLVILSVIPINKQSNQGKILSSTYLLIFRSLHLEDTKAFYPNQSYVFGYEPHSIMPVGVSALCGLTGLMPLTKVKGLASSAVFHTPFMRHIWTWLGISAATRKNFISFLNDGYSCVIIPGGVAEIIHMQIDSEVAFIKSRRGFVRIAIEAGRPLVPVFCFGQSSIFMWRPEWKLYQQIARALKFGPILFWGVFGSPVPYRQVNEVHNQFIEALRNLFENHKARVGHDDLQLRIL